MSHHAMTEEPSRKVKTQHPRDYTVQIRIAGTDEIVGTGVAVDATRVVTCAHVVEAATGAAPCAGSDALLDVYYPQAAGSGAEKTRAARVDACFPAHDDDVVLLALEGSAPLGPEQFPTLGYAELSAGHKFRAYGYKRLGKYQAGHAYGTVMGCVECPPGFTLQADPVELNSPHLAGGMSGAGVLDTERNLVVGLVSEVFFTPEHENRDVGWAVDAQVLAFDPVNLPLAEVAQPKVAAPTPPELPDPRLGLLRPREPLALHGAPPVLEEWVGRDDLLAALTADWRDAGTTITALIGFGGEGKSSLARKWMSNVLRQTSNVKSQALDGILWWSFYDEPSAESFFEALLAFLGGERIDMRSVPSASARMKLAARMLRGGRYLLILDGFEVMQHQEGDDYGLLRSADLRAFLEYLASPGGDAPGDAGPFTVITSRAPLLDLLPYTTAAQRDVTRLSAADGRALLRALGVQGADADLDRVVRAWDGHALTLSLLGSLLAERYDGDLRRIDDLPAPTADEDRYARVHRVLRRYDEHLTPAERAFLTTFSAFRTPVTRDAIERVYTSMPESQSSILNSQSSLPKMLNQLTTYRLLKYNPHNQTYTTHPLIRNHYFALFTQGDAARTRATHERIKEVYLELAGDTPRYPSLDDLRPLIEVVHHACRAGAYDEGYQIYKERIDQQSRWILTNVLGAWETDLNLMHEFFPRQADGAPDTTADPQVSDPGDKRWILNEVGLCLMSLGRLRDAVPFYERVAQLDQELADDWSNASKTIRNLAELHLHLGDLKSGATAARHALDLARKAENQQDERNSLAWLAWAVYLRGDTPAALDHFAQVESLYQEIESDKKYAYSLPGIWYADTLIRAAKTLRRPAAKSPIRSSAETQTPSPAETLTRFDAEPLEYARRITEANLEICERNRWVKSVSQCHRVLGDLDAAPIPNPSPTSGGRESSPSPSGTGGEGDRGDEGGRARAHYDEALRIARSITKRNVLIEALIARGRYLAQTRQAVDQAFADLREALDLATRGGYRRYEADARVALAWAHLAAAEAPIPGPSPTRGGRGRALARAREEARRAHALSTEMGYRWGVVDAGEVGREIEDER